MPYFHDLFQGKEVDHMCEHFSVIRPYLPKEQSHPEEGAYEMVNEDTWRQHMNELGQIEDDLNLRKVINDEKEELNYPKNQITRYAEILVGMCEY